MPGTSAFQRIMSALRPTADLGARSSVQPLLTPSGSLWRRTGSYGSSSRLLNLLNLAMVLETQLSQQPSAFTISVVFGGTIGLVAANLLGYDGGAGFFIGAGLVFLILAILIIQARQGESIEIRLDALADLIVADLAAKDWKLEHEKDWKLEQRSTSEDSPSHSSFGRVFDKLGDLSSGRELEERELEEIISYLKESLDKETEARARAITWSQLFGRIRSKPFTPGRYITPSRYLESEDIYRRVFRRLIEQRNIRRR